MIKEKVVAIIRNGEWKFLIWKYSIGKNSWTLPKWWIEDSDENNENALFRELWEELKISKNDVNIIKPFNNPYIKISSEKDIKDRVEIFWECRNYSEAHYFGFLLDFIWNEKDIDITFTNEFSQYKWVEIEELRELIYNVEMFDYFNN